MSAPTKPAEKPRVDLLFIGVVDDGEGRLLQEFREVIQTDGQFDLAEGKQPRLYLKLGNAITPGCIISVCYEPDQPSQVFPATQRYAGRWHSSDDCAKWTAQWRAAVNAKKEAKAAKEAMKDDAAVERLLPFRHAYANLNAEGRRQLLAEMMRYVTGGRV